MQRQIEDDALMVILDHNLRHHERRSWLIDLYFEAAPLSGIAFSLNYRSQIQTSDRIGHYFQWRSFLLLTIRSKKNRSCGDRVLPVFISHDESAGKSMPYLPECAINVVNPGLLRVGWILLRHACIGRVAANCHNSANCYQ